MQYRAKYIVSVTLIGVILLVLRFSEPIASSLFEAIHE